MMCPLKRSQPDSNWCKRFCRPVPNHSDMRPNEGFTPFALQSYGFFGSPPNILAKNFASNYSALIINML